MSEVVTMSLLGGKGLRSEVVITPKVGDEP